MTRSLIISEIIVVAKYIAALLFVHETKNLID